MHYMKWQVPWDRILHLNDNPLTASTKWLWWQSKGLSYKVKLSVRKHDLTPWASIPMMGITLSLAIDCSIRGDPYRPPMEEEIEEMYNPARKSTPTIETWNKTHRCTHVRMRLNTDMPKSEWGSTLICPIQNEA